MTIQGARYEIALSDIMERSNDNPELVNSMNNFLKELKLCARFGRSDAPFHPKKVEQLINYFQEQAKELEKLR